MERTVEHESDGYTNSKWCSWYSHQRSGTGTRRLRNNRTSGGYPNYSIYKNRQNTERSPGDLRILAITQTPVRNHQLMLVGKNRKGVNNNINEKMENYFNLARELKKLWNIKVTVIAIAVRALGRIQKGLVKGLEDLEIREQVQDIQTTALLRSDRILRGVLEIWWDLLSLKLQWETIS